MELNDGASLRERIKAQGFTIKGFAERLSKKYDLYVISDVTLSRALHHARGGRAEAWVRGVCADELKRWEAQDWR